ncbi:MAG: hypothetical protein LLG05_06075, partial [Porphyromonadaceae bacterium]|nr:hypothetical protein [Porphyromonadaceae bacterium]
MKFFNYLFCRLYCLNCTVSKELKIPVFPSIVGVSFYQVLNIFTICLCILMAYDSQDEINIYVNLGGMLFTGAILIFNTIYYGKTERYRAILKEIEKMPQTSRWVSNFFCIVYLVTSLSAAIFAVR